MSTAVRQLIADKIKLDNSAFIVKAFPVGVPENLAKGKVYVNVWREGLNNSAQTASLGEDLRIIVITTKTGTEEAENALEDALDAVLTSLTALNYVLWDSANRATIADTYNGYEIILRANTTNPYK